MSKFGSFGIAHTRMWVKPGKLKAILIGEFNTGKTSFLGSNEAALIWNLDLSSTPVPSIDSPGLPAQMWPGLNPDGQPINFDGTPARLDYPSIKAMYAQLLEAAKNNSPRPETIIIDSATELFNILRRETLIHFKKATWDEGRGEAMWEWLYQELNTLLSGLAQAGYGVWMVCHIAPEYITEDDGKKKTRWAMTTPPGFFKRFYGSFELALELKKTLVPKKKEVIRRIPMPDGSITELKELVSFNETEFVLVGENPDRASLYKRRVCFPIQLQVPPVGAWSLFEKEYLKVAVPPTTK